MTATGAAPGNSAVRRGQALGLELVLAKRATKKMRVEGGRQRRRAWGPRACAGRRETDVPPPCALRQTAAVTASEVKRTRTRL